MPRRRHSKRVEAWMYVVINPILESLERETLLLADGNLTWRAHSGRCEAIRVLQDYIDHSQWPNYEDFLEEHRDCEFTSTIAEHDSGVHKINATAARFYRSLLDDQEFMSSLEGELSFYEEQRRLLRSDASELIHSIPELPRLVVEYVINNAQSLPSHYLISAFWNANGRKLLRYRETNQFRDVSRDSEDLARVADRLKRDLTSLRFALSRSFDIPAANVPSISFAK